MACGIIITLSVDDHFGAYTVFLPRDQKNSRDALADERVEVRKIRLSKASGDQTVLYPVCETGFLRSLLLWYRFQKSGQ